MDSGQHHFRLLVYLPRTGVPTMCCCFAILVSRLSAAVPPPKLLQWQAFGALAGGNVSSYLFSGKTWIDEFGVGAALTLNSTQVEHVAGWLAVSPAWRAVREVGCVLCLRSSIHIQKACDVCRLFPLVADDSSLRVRLILWW